MKLSGSSVPSNRQKAPTNLAPTERPTWGAINLPPEVTSVIPKEVRAYLGSRNFDVSWLREALGFSWWPGLDRIVIPYHDKMGDIIFLAAHSPFGALPKYLYPTGPKPLYIPEEADEGMRAVIVEGQYDAIAVADVGFHGIAIGGSYLAPHAVHDLIEAVSGREVAIMLDGDAPAAAGKLFEQLLEFGVYPSLIMLERDEDPASIDRRKLEDLLCATRSAAREKK